MTANEITYIGAPEWKPLTERLPGFSAYEVSHRGKVRSVDRRLADGRQVKGRTLKQTVSGTSPYPQVDLYDDTGKRRTFSVHSLVLLAYVGKCPEGQEALHLNDDPLDNRWPENLGYGTHPENVVQRMRNRPAQPKPAKVCARCSHEFTGNGRRCHTCVVQLGELAATLLAGGVDLEAAAEQLSYPSAAGIWRLAVRYGNARVVIYDAKVTGSEPERERRPWWLRRVIATLCERLEEEDAE